MSARAAPPLALVLLAAGASRRLGRPKALVSLGAGAHDTPLERLLEAGAVLGDAAPLVVVGAAAAAIGAHLAGRPAIECLFHPGWAAGRTGSLQAALVRRAGRDLCVAPIDVPLVPAEVFRALDVRWRQLGRPAEGWLAPALPGARHGHPVVIGRGLLERLKGFPPDRPLRELRALARPLETLEVHDPAILDDLDTPEDLERLRARRSRRGPQAPPAP